MDLSYHLSMDSKSPNLIRMCGFKSQLNQLQTRLPNVYWRNSLSRNECATIFLLLTFCSDLMTHTLSGLHRCFLCVSLCFCFCFCTSLWQFSLICLSMQMYFFTSFLNHVRSYYSLCMSLRAQSSSAKNKFCQHSKTHTLIHHWVLYLCFDSSVSVCVMDNSN